MTQSDPGGLFLSRDQNDLYGHFFSLGSLPVWVVNKSSKVLVPKVIFYVLLFNDNKCFFRK